MYLEGSGYGWSPFSLDNYERGGYFINNITID